MEPNHQRTAHQSPATRVLQQIESCLRQKCVVCIEHTPVVTPRWSAWETWGTPDYYRGDIDQIYGEIDQCRVTHADHYIRLSIEDYSCSCRFCFVVHSPCSGAPC